MHELVAPHSKLALRRDPPALVLIAVNFIPLIGVAFWGWTLFEIVVLYWFENVVIGAINVLKIATCAPDEQQLRKANQHRPRKERGPETPLEAHIFKLFLIPFFTFHYGMFCFVHGVFVFGLLGNQEQRLFGESAFALVKVVGDVLVSGPLVAALAVTGSHVFSYVFHFLLRGEFRRSDPGSLMMAPYGRVVVLHIAILFGAFATVVLGQPLLLLLLLIGGKTLLDWHFHVRSHEPGEKAPARKGSALTP